MNQGLVTIRHETVELTRLLKDSAKSVQALTQAKQQTLTFDLPSQPVYITGDPNRLIQVFNNLLHNATKFTGEGGHIGIAIIMEDAFAIVRIEDNGLGIEPLLLPHIFELFTQGQRSLGHSEGGLGLGLALVQKLVKLHKGEITVISSGINQGATFIVKLPRHLKKTALTEPYE